MTSLEALALDMSQACRECAHRVGRAARRLPRPDRRSKVAARRARGQSLLAIARALGVSWTTVKRDLEGGAR